MKENYYILLELEPSEDDWAVIDAAISKHQRLWSMKKSQGSPTQQREAARYLQLISDMRDCLSNPDTRWQEARAASEQIEAERTAQLAKLDQLIKLIAETEVLQEDVEVFRREAGDRVTADDVKARLRQLNIEVKRPQTAPRREPRPMLEPALRQDLRDNLDKLKKKDLYDLLGLTRRSSWRALRSAADQVLTRKITDPVKAQVSNRLAELAKTVFRTKRTKTLYDNSVDFEAMGALVTELEKVGGDKYLDRAEMNGLVEMARGRGVTLDIALDFIEDYAEAHQWKVQRWSEELPSAQLKLCGYCGALARTPEDNFCHDCGKPLVMKCPHCGAMVPTQDKFCECGCSTGDRPLVERLIEQAEQARLNGDREHAEELHKLVCWYWPKCEECGRDDTA